MPANRTLPIDWSRYTLKADIVAREITSLTPYAFTSLAMPPVAPEDFALLVDSVQANGVYEPLTITPDGEVVDGQARLQAAESAGIHQVPTRTLEARGGEEDYALWAAAVNVGRRHLTPGQRLGIVKAVLTILEDQARNRQEATRFGHGMDDAASGPARPNLDGPSESVDVRTRIGDMLGVSRSQAAKMVTLVKHGSDELQDDVAAGRTSIHRAHETLRARATRPTYQDRESRALDAANRRDFAADPLRTLRLIAGLIPEWVHDAETWEAPRRSEFGRALQNMVDSCELAFRRLSLSA